MIYKCLIKCMDHELKACDLYYYKATKYKDEFPSVANIMNEIASNKLSHYEKLMNSMQNLIERSEGDEMKVFWKYEKLRLSEKYDELKYKIAKFSI